MVPAPFVYNATVLEAVDGDTLMVKVDWGMRRYDLPIPVRLAGCAAREKADPGGPEAKANLSALLPAGTPVTLHTVKPDKYQPRWLAYVHFQRGEDELDLMTVLCAAHWVVPWDGRGSQPKPPWPRPEDTPPAAPLYLDF